MITIEQIKEMNIPVGTPIEMTIRSSISGDFNKLPENKKLKQIGYFIKIKESKKNPILKYTPILNFPEIAESYLLKYIENIKILEYQK